MWSVLLHDKEVLKAELMEVVKEHSSLLVGDGVEL